MSCIAFNILGLKGAFSGAHMDALSGTWVRNLGRLKLWMIIPERLMSEHWDEFSEAGD
ncbi:hypothetical protein LTR85_012148 [Meristemomyces frigidus]|nr:hypothetical protein LTR85_012148 [Meristemomyces frigidus]